MAQTERPSYLSWGHRIMSNISVSGLGLGPRDAGLSALLPRTGIRHFLPRSWKTLSLGSPFEQGGLDPAELEGLYLLLLCGFHSDTELGRGAYVDLF